METTTLKQTLLDNWQFLTLLIAMLGSWISLKSDIKSDMASLKTELRADMAALKAELRLDMSDIKGQSQHLIDLHIDHGDRISKVEERTKKL